MIARTIPWKLGETMPPHGPPSSLGAANKITCSRTRSNEASSEEELKGVKKVKKLKRCRVDSHSINFFHRFNYSPGILAQRSYSHITPVSRTRQGFAQKNPSLTDVGWAE